MLSWVALAGSSVFILLKSRKFGTIIGSEVIAVHLKHLNQIHGKNSPDFVTRVGLVAV
jgi:hypothetical protein